MRKVAGFASCAKPPFKAASIPAAAYRSAGASWRPRLYSAAIDYADPPGRARARRPSVTAIRLRGRGSAVGMP